MKKLLLVLFLMTTGLGCTWAQTKKSMVIQKADGTTETVAIDNNTTFQFNGSNVEVMDGKNLLLTISTQDIQRLKFGSTTGVKFVNPGDASSLSLVLNGNNLTIKGLQKETAVTLYQMNGRVCQSKVLAPAGSLAVGQLPAGVYFVKVGNSVFKFLKK